MTPDPKHLAGQSASKLAQMIGEVIIHHAPWTSEINETTKRRITDAWLEDLEKHATKVVGPLIDNINANVDVPEPIKGLLDHAKIPSAQFGSLIQQFFIWGVMFNLASTVLQPLTQAVGNELWAKFPDRPISPPDLATMTVRGIGQGDSAGVNVPAWAISMAAESGISEENFLSLVGATGMAPNLTALFEMIRRGIIDTEQLTKGIKQGDIKDEWIPYVEKLRYILPSPTDFVRAAVQAQLPYSEAKDWAFKVGLEPDDFNAPHPPWFDLLHNIAGRPPGPVEAGHMANRGIIPWDGLGPDVLSFAQAIAESDVKTKWTPALEAIMEYVPPPGEVRMLLLHGGIDEQTAVELWKKNGVPEDIASAYAHLASVEQITQDKALAKGDIETMIQEQLLTDEQATEKLKQIGYTDGNAAFIIKMAHFRYELEAERAAVRTIGRYYATWKMTNQGAKDAFIALGIQEQQANNLLDRLEVQRQTTSPIPSEAQIASGMYYGIIPQNVAQSMLQDLGYSPWHAWFLLSARAHGKLPNEPTEGRPQG